MPEPEPATRRANNDEGLSGSVRPARGLVRRLTSSLSGRLKLLTLAVLAPAIATAGLLVWDAYRHERAFLEQQMMETARAMSLVVDRQIGQQEVMLQALGSSPYVASGDWAGLYRQASQAITSPHDWLVVLDANGQQLLNTRTPWGTKLPVTPLDDGRFSWASPRASRFRVSNLFIGRVNNRSMVVVSLAVPRPDGAPVTLNLGTTAESFASIWPERQFPAPWIGAVLDEDMQVVARNRDIGRYIGAVPSPATQRALRAAKIGVMESRTLDGVASVTAWSRESDYGWSFLVAVPKSAIVSAAQRSLLWGMAGAVLLLALGVVLAAWVAASIARPVKALAGAARAWGEGAPVQRRSTGMAETDHLAAAFADAAEAVAGHQVELRQLNASLEARVAERTRALEDATESLVQAQKLEAIGRLTGGVAHDFNNLLMAVSGNLELLSRRVTDLALARYVDRARQAAERGAKLTAQLLAFSRRQRLEAKSTDINAAVEAATDLLSGALGAAVIDMRLGADLWSAFADPTQLELVIVNLSINAQHAMPEGGVVTIATANAVREAPSGQTGGPPAGEFVVISVSDTGAGMTPEVAARAFEPFFTTKGVGEGSGLGLPQVLGLAKQLGGGVELTTAPGAGCRVDVYLPRAAAGPSSAASANLDAIDAAAFNGLHVLLVDDDRDVRTVARGLLGDMGCRVTEAPGGQEAIQLVEAGGAFDLVLLDFAMPGMNGGEAAQRLRQISPATPQILMSGFADADTLMKVWSGPLLQKPFSAGQLALQMQAALRGCVGSDISIQVG